MTPKPTLPHTFHITKNVINHQEYQGSNNPILYIIIQNIKLQNNSLSHLVVAQQKNAVEIIIVLKKIIAPLPFKMYGLILLF